MLKKFVMLTSQMLKRIKRKRKRKKRIKKNSMREIYG
jgi:heme exporter protein D